MGLGFTIVLILLGMIREVIGQGTLFTNMSLIFGEMAANWQIVVFYDYPDFLFAILPPGAFVAMGLIIAIKNLVDNYLEEKAKANQAEVEVGSKRARVTGKIS